MADWHTGAFALLGDSASLPDLPMAATRLQTAILAQERIALVGDCDVDGLTATAIMLRALQRLGADVAPPIIAPRRDDGRGLTADAAQQIIASEARLCLTVDNGSSSVAEVATLQARDIATIITDHHHIETNPGALALVNPQRSDSQYANPGISGAGIALHLAHALLGYPAWEDERMTRLIALAGLGTLADVVPLTAENHALVVQSVTILRREPLAGMRALADLARVDWAALTARDISYSIAPMLNAAGRMGDPLVALAALMTGDVREAMIPARQLQEWNQLRQAQTEFMLTTARAQALARPAAPIVYVESDAWPLGLVGLIAGRLATEFDRLAVVVAIQGDQCRGSLRGPAWFHIAEALAAFDPPLAQAGGHARAGGFATSREQLPALREHLDRRYRAAQEHRDDPQRESLIVDAQIRLADIQHDHLQRLTELAPFDATFPEPLFVTTNVTVRQVTVMKQAHLRLLAAQGEIQRACFWPQGAAQVARLQAIPGPVDIIWKYQPSRWRSEFPEPIVVAVFPAQTTV
jgi:single-stranded-DNA-specific exonuclease